MSPRALSFCCLFTVGAACNAVSGAEAQLIPKSPFMPAPGAGAANPTAGASLEYRGYVEMGNGREFILRDPAKKTRVWLRLNEHDKDFGVTVKQYDVGNETVTVEHQGRTFTLAEPKSKVVSSGSAAHAMPPPMPSTVPAAVTQAVVLNPTPADETNRLNAVAAEVSRRRALREQAAQQVQGAAPQIAVPAMPVQAMPPPGSIQPQNAPVNQPGRNYQPPPVGSR